MKQVALRPDISPDRIIFSDTLPKEDHLKIKALADIGLDTVRFNGHTTVADLLWAGIPVISLSPPNSLMASRIGGSLVSAAGLEDLVATSHRQYEEKAIELAKDPVRLQQLKNHLAKRDTPLFNTQQFVLDLEKGFMELWNRAENFLPLENIDIAKLKPSTTHHDEL